MDRTVYINIGNRKYPMRFSLGASIRLSEKYGSLEKMTDGLTGKGEEDGEVNTEKAITTLIEVLEILTAQGCAYKNVFECDLPVPDEAPVKDGKYIPPTRDEIELGINITDMAEVKELIFKTITGGNKREVKSDEGSKKNENT